MVNTTKPKTKTKGKTGFWRWVLCRGISAALVEGHWLSQTSSSVTTTPGWSSKCPCGTLPCLRTLLPVCCCIWAGWPCSCNPNIGRSLSSCYHPFPRRCWWQGGPEQPGASWRRRATGAEAGWRAAVSWSGSGGPSRDFLVGS